MARHYTVNGLNQYVSAGADAIGYDANGNLTSDGVSAYVYDVENRLVSASGAATASLRYDPLGRLYETSGGMAGITRFLYDGDELVGEYSSAGTTLRRYAHGPGSDDPLIWYEGASMGTTNRRVLLGDHQGSIVSVASDTGALVTINRYDDWGVPDASNAGRFQYTGQAWIPELRMYHYKARIYSPTLGRFMQTDPIGYDDGPHLYAYVGNDPVNGVDPTGMYECAGDSKGCEKQVEAYRKDMLRAAASYNRLSAEARAIRSANRILGDAGKDNGVSVRFADLPESNNPAHTALNSDGSSTITLDIAAIGKSSSFGAAVLGHELMHVEQNRSRGGVDTYNDLYRREQAAYWLSGVIAGGLGLSARAAGIPVLLGTKTNVGFVREVKAAARNNCTNSKNEEFIGNRFVQVKPGSCK